MIADRSCISEECQKPQPPLLLKKVSQHTSNLYCNTPPIYIAVLSAPLRSEEREICQYSSHLYRSTPPICIAIRLPFVSQYFWENLGGCGHWDVPQYWSQCQRNSEECWKPQPPLLLRKRVSQYTSNFSVVLKCFRCHRALRKWKYFQYSHLYRITPLICIAVRLPFVSQCFGENIGGWVHRDVSQ